MEFGGGEDLREGLRVAGTVRKGSLHICTRVGAHIWLRREGHTHMPLAGSPPLAYGG